MHVCVVKISAVPSRNNGRISLRQIAFEFRVWILLYVRFRSCLREYSTCCWETGLVVSIFSRSFLRRLSQFWEKSSRHTRRKWQITTNRNRKPFKSWKTLRQSWEFTRSVPHKPVNPGMCDILYNSSIVNKLFVERLSDKSKSTYRH